MDIEAKFKMYLENLGYDFPEAGAAIANSELIYKVARSFFFAGYNAGEAQVLRENARKGK